MPINFPNFGLKQVDEYTPKTIKAFGAAFITTFKIPCPSQVDLMPNYLLKCGEFFIKRLLDPNTRAPEELCNYFLHENERARFRTTAQTKHRNFSQNNLSVQGWFFQSSQNLGQLHDRIEQNITEGIQKYQSSIESYFVNNDIRLCIVLHQAYATLRVQYFKINETITLANVNEENLMAASLDIIGRLNQFDFIIADLERRWGLEIIGYLLRSNLNTGINSQSASDMLNLYENCETSDEVNELTLNIIKKHISDPFKKRLQSIQEEIDKFKSLNEIQEFQKIFNNFTSDAQKKLSAEEITDKITLLRAWLNIGFINLETLTLQQKPVEQEQKKIVHVVFNLNLQDCMAELNAPLSALANTDIDLTPLHLILDKIVWIRNFYEALSQQPLNFEDFELLRQVDKILKESRDIYKVNADQYQQFADKYQALINSRDELEQYQNIFENLEAIGSRLSLHSENLSNQIEKLKSQSTVHIALSTLLLKIFELELADLKELNEIVIEQKTIINDTINTLIEIQRETSQSSPLRIDLEENRKESKEEEDNDGELSENPLKKRRLDNKSEEFTEEKENNIIHQL